MDTMNYAELNKTRYRWKRFTHSLSLW